MRVRRSVLTAAIGSAVLASGTAVPASLAMDGNESASPHPVASLTRCSPARHRAVFAGRMTTVQGADRMAMRFTLLEGSRRAGWSAVRSRKLAHWHQSMPGVRTFVYRQRVRGLPTGSAYRVLVRFRWYSSDGELVLRTRRRSRSCWVPGPRPNLRVLRIRELNRFDGGREATYAVRVGNLGTAPARSAPVTLLVDDAAVDTLDAGRLEPGETRRLSFVGPSCERPDSPIVALADPDHQIRESRERDNRLATTCSDIR